MAENDDFLAAIKDNPLDDDLRKVYADFLEENGEPDEADRQRRYPEIRAESVKWMTAYADQLGSDDGYDDEMTYEKLMAIAKDYLENGGGYTLGFDTPDMVWESAEEFWKHYEIITAVEAPDPSATFFRCAC